jgi:membrane protein implicated in regulation of membrane protease activity
MDPSIEKSKGLRGIAALFDDMERKDIFRKYLYFLCWVELGILLTCWLYQIGDSGREGEPAFPWRLYFLVAFLAPVAITFLTGTVIVGFNRYFAEPDPGGQDRLESQIVENDGTGRIQQLSRMVAWIQKLPFLALLLLLGVGTAFFYKLDSIAAIVGAIGEKSVKILLTSLIVIFLVASIFALVLIVLNYRLRKTAMEYQYKTQVAEKLGLVILEDNTVLNSSGRLLVNGAKFKKAALQLLPEVPAESQSAGSKSGENPCAESTHGPADLET